MSKNTVTLFWLAGCVLLLLVAFGLGWVLTDAIKPVGGDLAALGGVGALLLLCWAGVADEIAKVRKR